MGLSIFAIWVPILVFFETVQISGASKETRSGADGSKTDEKPFCGDKGASKHLAGIQSGTRELH